MTLTHRDEDECIHLLCSHWAPQNPGLHRQVPVCDWQVALLRQEQVWLHWRPHVPSGHCCVQRSPERKMKSLLKLLFAVWGVVLRKKSKFHQFHTWFFLKFWEMIIYKTDNILQPFSIKTVTYYLCLGSQIYFYESLTNVHTVEISILPLLYLHMHHWHQKNKTSQSKKKMRGLILI